MSEKTNKSTSARTDTFTPRSHAHTHSREFHIIVTRDLPASVLWTALVGHIRLQETPVHAHAACVVALLLLERKK